jgi:UDP-2,4-diacetamido-2,4,6-trideoxy-beta-L-altropyranose hydrolase
MSSEAKVSFFVNTFPDEGLGHLSRCLVLAEALKKKSAVCHFFLTHLNPPISLRGFSAAPIEIEKVDSDVAIVDGRNFDIPFFNRLKSRTRQLVLLDDLADRPFPANIVLNHNIYGESLDYAEYKADDVLAGLRYALIHREFFALRDCLSPSEPRILIALGGGAATPLGIDLARMLHDRYEIPIDLVLNHASASEVQLPSPAVQIHRNAQMPRLMEDASLVICGLGVTFLEVLASGLPVVGVQMAGNQHLAFSAARKAGLVVKKSDTAAVVGAIAEVLSAPPHPDFPLFDERGSDRAAEAILSAL